MFDTNLITINLKVFKAIILLLNKYIPSLTQFQLRYKYFLLIY